MLIILISFPSRGCIEDVVNIKTNNQFTSVTVIHFMNDAGVCIFSNSIFWKKSPRFQFITTSLPRPQTNKLSERAYPLPNYYDPPDNCNPTHHPQCWIRNTIQKVHGKEILKLLCFFFWYSIFFSRYLFLN